MAVGVIVDGTPVGTCRRKQTQQGDASNGALRRRAARLNIPPQMRRECLVCGPVSNGISPSRAHTPTHTHTRTTVGCAVGASVGARLGPSVGSRDGIAVGRRVGRPVGVADGATVTSRTTVGTSVGLDDTGSVSRNLPVSDRGMLKAAQGHTHDTRTHAHWANLNDGSSVGKAVGARDGSAVGAAVGGCVGAAVVGATVGSPERTVGMNVGKLVGLNVDGAPTPSSGADVGGASRIPAQMWVRLSPVALPM